MKSAELFEKPGVHLRTAEADELEAAQNGEHKTQEGYRKGARRDPVNPHVEEGQMMECFALQFTFERHAIPFRHDDSADPPRSWWRSPRQSASLAPRAGLRPRLL